MKRFVRVCAVSLLAVAVSGGMAEADSPAKKRKPTFFEQIFGSPSKKAERKAKRRNLFGRDRDSVGEVRPIRLIDQPRSKKNRIADADPEPDPGLGMGNLTYAAPRMLAVSGLSLAEPRPADAAAAAIYDQLSGSGPGFRLLPDSRDALLEQYGKRAYRPVFVANGELSPRGKSVLALLSAANEEGLEAEAYLPTGLSAFNAPLPSWDAAAMARLDIDLYAAALRYARDASGGVFDPRKLSRYNDVTPPWVEAGKAAQVLAWSPYPDAYLKGLHPTHPAYAAMKAALAERRGASDSEPPEPIPGGKIVKTGASDERIPALRMRLIELGYPEAAAVPGSDDMVLDKALSEQLRRFQEASGLRVTGALGPQTLTALNADSSRREIAALVDNMERMRWLPRELGRRHVFVNQAAYEATVVKDGQPEWSTRVIVGRPTTQTSVFHDEMELVVFNPSWGVPASIIANEYLPKLRRDPGYLDRMGFKVVTQQGKVVPSRSISWASYGKKVPFGVHQPPGAKNALGEIKFLFPNSHDIYMHDTPSRELFTEDTRAFSHGCVRVQNPREFAAVLLGWDAAEVDSHIGTPKTETVRLKEKIPVHLTYFTAWPDASGKIRFFDDVYGRDRAMEDARSSVAVAQR
jgi:murein L,D-transpeptidase YcbB/YkuD